MYVSYLYPAIMYRHKCDENSLLQRKGEGALGRIGVHDPFFLSLAATGEPLQHQCVL